MGEQITLSELKLKCIFWSGIEQEGRGGGKYCCYAVCFMVKVPLAEVMTLNPSTSEWRERDRGAKMREETGARTFFLLSHSR